MKCGVGGSRAAILTLVSTVPEGNDNVECKKQAEMKQSNIIKSSTTTTIESDQRIPRD